MCAPHFFSTFFNARISWKKEMIFINKRALKWRIQIQSSDNISCFSIISYSDTIRERSCTRLFALLTSGQRQNFLHLYLLKQWMNPRVYFVWCLIFYLSFFFWCCCLFWAIINNGTQEWSCKRKIQREEIKRTTKFLKMFVFFKIFELLLIFDAGVGFHLIPANNEADIVNSIEELSFHLEKEYLNRTHACARKSFVYTKIISSRDWSFDSVRCVWCKTLQKGLDYTI